MRLVNVICSVWAATLGSICCRVKYMNYKVMFTSWGMRSESRLSTETVRKSVAFPGVDMTILWKLHRIHSTLKKRCVNIPLRPHLKSEPKSTAKSAQLVRIFPQILVWILRVNVPQHGRPQHGHCNGSRSLVI